MISLRVTLLLLAADFAGEPDALPFPAIFLFAVFSAGFSVDSSTCFAGWFSTGINDSVGPLSFVLAESTAPVTREVVDFPGVDDRSAIGADGSLLTLFSSASDSCSFAI
jgi:hypothetical protein